jgi:hypothetical protein
MKLSGHATDNQETPLSPPATLRTTATTVLIGNKLFDLPSPACWLLALALELHQVLQPIAIHFTMIQGLQLARKLTRFKVITATKGQKIKRDIFTASMSVRDLIDSIDTEPHQVISILKGWHRQTFKTMEKLLQKRLQQLKYNSELATNLPEASSPGKSSASPVIDLQDTPPCPQTICLPLLQKNSANAPPRALLSTVRPRPPGSAKKKQGRKLSRCEFPQVQTQRVYNPRC